MSSRLADLSQETKASQISSPWPGGGGGRAQKKKSPTLNNPSYKYGNRTGRIVGTFRKRLTISPTNN